MHRQLRRLTVAASLFLTAALAAQTTPTLRVSVQLVNVVATVTDNNGKYVSNLSQNDFVLEEDGAPQTIAHFTQDHDIPVSVGILLDTSGSMQPKIATATRAVEKFVNNVHKDDDIFLMTFDSSVDVKQDFTSDRRRLSRAMDSIRTGGGTSLYDALSAGLEKIRKGRHDKRALLLISDGFDAGSRRATADDVSKAIRRSEVLVYGLGTAATTYADPAEHVPFTLPTVESTSRGPSAVAVSPRGPSRRGGTAISGGVNMSLLTRLAEESGGRGFLLSETFINTGATEIDSVLTLIADELRSQYTLSYYPAAGDDGKAHRIRVTSPGYNVRARSGYTRD